MIQNHNSHNEFGLVLLSHAEGTGKNTFTNFISSIIGEDYSAANVTNMTYILGNGARGTIGYKKLVVCNELQSFEHSKQNWDQMKTLITENVYYLRDCYDTKPRQMDNVNNFVFMSNNYDAVKIGQTDRRYFVLEVNESKAKNTEYFTELHQEIDGLECKRHFLRFLLNRDVKNYNYHEAPETTTKSELQECQKPHYEEFILRCRTDSEQRENGIVASDLWKLYTEYCEDNRIGMRIRIQSMNGLSQKIRHLVTTKAAKIKGVKYTMYFLNSDIAKAEAKQNKIKKVEEIHNRYLMKLAFSAFSRSK
jgi:hypothetical protein